MNACLEKETEDFCESDLSFENQPKRHDLEKIVPIYILNYFNDKNIFNEELISPKYIDLCIDTNICDGVDKAYLAMEKSGKFDTNSSEHMISEDIRFVIKTLNNIKKFVPQEFSAGVLLMHLEFVEGIKF